MAEETNHRTTPEDPDIARFQSDLSKNPLTRLIALVKKNRALALGVLAIGSLGTGFLLGRSSVQTESTQDLPNIYSNATPNNPDSDASVDSFSAQDASYISDASASFDAGLLPDASVLHDASATDASINGVQNPNTGNLEENKTGSFQNPPWQRPKGEYFSYVPDPNADPCRHTNFDPSRVKAAEARGEIPRMPPGANDPATMPCKKVIQGLPPEERAAHDAEQSAIIINRLTAELNNAGAFTTDERGACIVQKRFAAKFQQLMSALARAGSSVHPDRRLQSCQIER